MFNLNAFSVRGLTCHVRWHRPFSYARRRGIPPRRLLRLRRPGARVAAPDEQLRAAARRSARRRRPPHRPSEGEGGDLPVHGRRPQPPGDVRPQAAAQHADGQTRPAGVRRSEVSVHPDATPGCSARSATFRKHGQSGIEVSDLFPHTAKCIDDIAVIRSCHGDMVVHSAAQYELFTGRVVPGFPSMGSWVVYGWAPRAESLPAYVVMPDPQGRARGGPADVRATASCRRSISRRCSAAARGRCCNLDLPPGVSPEQRRKTLDLIRDLNEATLEPDDEEFAGPHQRLRSGVPMQTEAPAGLRPVRRTAGDAGPVRHRRRADRRLRPPLPAGAAAGREGRALRRASSPAAGPATCSGTRTTTSRRTTAHGRRRPTGRSPAC